MDIQEESSRRFLSGSSLLMVRVLARQPISAVPRDTSLPYRGRSCQSVGRIPRHGSAPKAGSLTHRCSPFSASASPADHGDRVIGTFSSGSSVYSATVLLVRLRAQGVVGFDLAVDVHITAFPGGLLIQLAASARLRVFAFFLLCALAIRNAGHFAPK